jgi:hypothetical protein
MKQGLLSPRTSVTNVKVPHSAGCAASPRLIYRLTLVFSGQVSALSPASGANCEIDARTGEVINEGYISPLTGGPFVR